MSKTQVLDVLFAEIGSTKTMVTGYTGLERQRPQFEGQGVSGTTVKEGDVCIGLERAILDLKERLGLSRLKWTTMMATCSAAGGLRMSVHGLVDNMTSRAAREAALGAGAIVVSESFGLLPEENLDDMMKNAPKIVLLAGGVEGGESEKVLENARRLAATNGQFRVVFAGNTHLRPAVREIFASSRVKLFVTENVYPAIDTLNITPARTLIHEIFEDKLIESPGMEKIRAQVDGPVLPTPGAVMVASQILSKQIGDLVAVDIGGATTDIHSVTEGSPEISEIQLNTEPYAKRTVEGDLGIYVNAPNLYRILVHQDTSARQKRSHMPTPLPLFPRSEEAIHFSLTLARTALSSALERHVGRTRTILTYEGEKSVAEGKDLTAVRWVIGTGGALTRLPGSLALLEGTFNGRKAPDRLLPKKKVRCLLDKHYVMAAAGLMGAKAPEIAWQMMCDSLGIDPGSGLP